MMKRSTLSIADIYVPMKRRATLDQKRVDEVAASILDEGLQAPILVRADGARFVLVEGLHRLEAAKALGGKTCPMNLLQMAAACAGRLIGMTVGCLEKNDWFSPQARSSTRRDGCVGQDARGCSKLRADATAAKMISGSTIQRNTPHRPGRVRETAVATIRAVAFPGRQHSSPPAIAKPTSRPPIRCQRPPIAIARVGDSFSCLSATPLAA
jgi:sulfiredoxin